MSDCNATAVLASEIERQMDDLSVSHRAMISVMKNMPIYLKKGNLANWESDYTLVISDDEDEKNKREIKNIYNVCGQRA